LNRVLLKFKEINTYKTTLQCNFIVKL